MSSTQERPSLIRGLLGGRRRAERNEEADKELDVALDRLSVALADNEGAVAAVRRRQSSGSLKIVSLPAPPLSSDPY